MYAQIFHVAVTHVLYLHAVTHVLYLHAVTHVLYLHAVTHVLYLHVVTHVLYLHAVTHVLYLHAVTHACTVSACILWCFAILGTSTDDRGYISSEPPKEFYVPVCRGQGMHCNTVVC